MGRTNNGGSLAENGRLNLAHQFRQSGETPVVYVPEDLKVVGETLPPLTILSTLRTVDLSTLFWVSFFLACLLAAQPSAPPPHARLNYKNNNSLDTMKRLHGKTSAPKNLVLIQNHRMILDSEIRRSK